VFRDGEIEGVVSEGTDVESVKHAWEAIKAQERAERSQHGVLDDVPVNLPALPRAQKLQKRAARVGFDWSDPGAVFVKLEEELAELREALESGARGAVEEELGDLLFTVVNLARHEKLDAEAALRRASTKFETRFRAMESQAREQDQRLEDLDANALEALWSRAKARERGS
jgi:ATP diphosphatase